MRGEGPAHLLKPARESAREPLRMQGLDVEEVKLAGKPRVEIVKRTDKTIRYPTEARTLQQAIDMCVAGDHISILPGVYNESAVISVDLDLFREGQKGEVCTPQACRMRPCPSKQACLLAFICAALREICVWI